MKITEMGPMSSVDTVGLCAADVVAGDVEVVVAFVAAVSAVGVRSVDTELVFVERDFVERDGAPWTDAPWSSHAMAKHVTTAAHVRRTNWIERESECVSNSASMRFSVVDRIARTASAAASIGIRSAAGLGSTLRR